MSTLIICLPPSVSASPSGAIALYDYAVSVDAVTPATHASALASLLPQADRGGEIVALVPVSRLSWHVVDIPKGVAPASPRMRIILDSLLEDRLLDDADQLHVALAPGASAGGRAWVAVCDQRWLREHLQILEAAGRPVSRIVPEFSPDAGPVQLHVVGDADAPFLVATGEAVGGLTYLPLSVAALAMLPGGLDTAVPAAGDEAARGVTAFAEPAHAAAAEQVLQRSVGLVTRPQRWLDAARSPWDMAQFGLASTSRTRTVKRMSGLARELWLSSVWRPARWGLAVLLGAHLVGLNAWAWQERSSLEARQAAVQLTLTQTFPQVKLVVDAPVQMERQVAALRQSTGASSGRDLEVMLSGLATVLPPDRSATAIEFAAGEVRVKGLGLETTALASVSSALKSQGYAVRLESDALIVAPAGKASP